MFFLRSEQSSQVRLCCNYFLKSAPVSIISTTHGVTLVQCWTCDWGVCVQRGWQSLHTLELVNFPQRLAVHQAHLNLTIIKETFEKDTSHLFLQASNTHELFLYTCSGLWGPPGFSSKLLSAKMLKSQSPSFRPHLTQPVSFLESEICSV